MLVAVGTLTSKLTLHGQWGDSKTSCQDGVMTLGSCATENCPLESLDEFMDGIRSLAG